MKRIYTILTLAILLVMGIGKVYAQVVDVCAGNDIVELHLGNYQYGLVQWQVSDDNEFWMDIDGAIDTVYRFMPERPRYYRAEVRFPACMENNYYSQVSYVQMPPKAFAGPDMTVPAGAVAWMKATPVEDAEGEWHIIAGTGGVLQDSLNNHSAFMGEEGEYKLTWTVTNSCGSNTDTVTVRCVPMEYQTDIVIVDETDVILSDSTQRLNGEYIICFNNPVPDIHEGSVLLGYRYPSLLRKVISFEREGNMFTMQTEAGTLTDIVMSGAFDFEPIVNPLGAPASTVKYLDHFPTRKDLQENPFLLRDGSIYVIKDVAKGKVSTDFEVETIIHEDNSLTVKVHEFDFNLFDARLDGLKYSCEFNLNPHFDANLVFANGDFEEVRIGLYNAETEFVQHVNLTKPLSTDLWEKDGRFNQTPVLVSDILVGMIPTYIMLDLPYLFEIDAHTVAPMAFAKTTRSTYTFEIYYNAETGQFNSIREKEEPVQETTFTNLNGTLSAAFETGLKASVLLADVFGPYFAIDGSLNPSVCANMLTDDIGGNISMGMDVDLGCRFQLFSDHQALQDRSMDFNLMNHNEYASKKVFKLGGDNQVYTLGQYLTDPISVKVTGWFGEPMPSHEVHFEAEKGEVSDEVVNTNIHGVASTQWKPGASSGFGRLMVKVYDCEGNLIGGSPQTFRAYASATDPCIQSNLTVEAYPVSENTIIPMVSGGRQPYLYSTDGLSYSVMQPTIHTQPGQNYSFYVRDANGCEAEATYNTPPYHCENGSLQLSAVVTGNTINASAFGGLEPYQYSIGGSFQSTGLFSGLFDGEYWVVVRDALGCECSKQVVVSRQGDLVVTLSEIEGYGGTACVLTPTMTLVERGICWSTHHVPTVQDFRASYGASIGEYAFTITALDPSMTYYVRAYALDASGTSYSREVCINPTNGVTLPIVAATGITCITGTTALGSGNVTYDGGTEVTERGICWGTNHNPVISGAHIVCGSGLGAFTANINNLTPNTWYFARAYATNSVGTAYGDEVEFYTGNGGGNEVPEGAINGLFSVAPGYQVYFSQGNLQYQPSTNTWRFAENQYDMIHTVDEMVYYDEEMEAYYCDVANEYASTYTGWIDMFGWGTSGYNHGAVCYQPWSFSLNEDDYNVYGSEAYNLYDQTGQADWGYNAISNGGNQQCQWRTLNGGEWVFLLDCRNTSSGVRFAKAKVGGVDGIIVLPDNWQVSTFALNNVNQKYAGFNSNIIGLSDWMVLEETGAVFLPASGARIGAQLFIVDDQSPVGEYWASSISPRFEDERYPSSLSFYEDGLRPRDYFNRSFGCGVRLVHEGQGAQPEGYSPWEFGPSGGGTGVENGITTESYTFLGLAYYGSCPILEKGACWSTSPNPTLADNHIAGDEGTDFVTGTIHGLTPNTTYYLKMFVTDSLYTYYSDEIEFTTLSDVPEGAINGLFSVGEGQQVYFSQGNLQYQASTNTWRFAENQWDYVGSQTPLSGDPGGTVAGSDNQSISSTYEGWIDLFGWGTSGYNHGAVCYQPWSTNETDTNYFAYAEWGCDLMNKTGQADWGFNAIVNAGNTENLWHSLSREEWSYLFNTRNTSSGIRYAKSQVNNVDGVVILPDDWNTSTFSFNNANIHTASYSSNIISSSQWIILENAGAVFLPAAGMRIGNTINDACSFGYYWASSVYFYDIGEWLNSGKYNDSNSFIGLILSPTYLSAGDSGNSRSFGYSVRLVYGEHTSSPQGELPHVEISLCDNISETSVFCKGVVMYDGGNEVTKRGMCWGTNVNPTISGNHTTNGSGIGEYEVNITGLLPSTVYYLRAYATNSLGTSYSSLDSIMTPPWPPAVASLGVNCITQNSATVHCFADANDVTECGICWSTNPNPTINDYHSVNESGFGEMFDYYLIMENLTANTTYYVRAYGINDVGISYGEVLSFNTHEENMVAPEGAINGLFTIGSESQVWFSKGNLQYNAALNEWRFAENQWDYIGEGNNNISSNYDGWIDLFGWGTSGYDHGAICYQPWSTSTNNDDYYAYGEWFNNLSSHTGQADWGYNPIENGGNHENQWHSLNCDRYGEWLYLLYQRRTISGILFAKALVNGINGVIIFPDNWRSSIYLINNANVLEATFDSNVLSASIWADFFENNGAVFLPAAGIRLQGVSSDVNNQGCYWGSTIYSSGGTDFLYSSDFVFDNSSLSLFGGKWRYYGLSVRLIQNYIPQKSNENNK